MRTQAPDFWNDAKTAEKVMKQVRELKGWIEGCEEVCRSIDDLNVLYEFAKEGEATEEEVDTHYAETLRLVENLELKNMLQGEADEMSCVLKINSGAGGTESQDWASMLMRMYIRWAENNHYKCSVSTLQDGDEAGIKTVTLQIEGDFAYGYLKGENGVHRLVRVSPFNAQGKRMTSFASVFVTPLVDDTIEISINQADRMLTKWNPVYVCAINTKTPIPAKKKKFSSKTQKPGTSLKTKRMHCANCVLSSTTKNYNTGWQNRPK